VGRRTGGQASDGGGSSRRTTPPGAHVLEACRQVQEEEILRAMREAPAVQVWACDLDAHEEE
jgi:hypothetical protein